MLDRSVEHAVMQVLQRQWGGAFSDHGQSFRTGGSADQTIAAAQAPVAAGYGWVVDLDFERFPDRVEQRERAAPRRRRPGGRRILGTLDHLPLTERNYELPVDRCRHPMCQGAQVRIGSEVSYAIGHIPASFIRVKHAQHMHACSHLRAGRTEPGYQPPPASWTHSTTRLHAVPAAVSESDDHCRTCG
jgi:hypothetical protein